MSEVIKDEFETIYDAFDCFKDRFLKDKKSIFTDNEVLNKDNLESIIKNFVNNPNESKDSFENKIKEQIGNESDIKNLFAHAVWLWGIFASDMKQESKVKDVNNWLPNGEFNAQSKFSFDHGVGSTGQYHKTNKPLELAYIIHFFKKALEQENHNDANYIEILQKPLKEKIDVGKMCFNEGCEKGKKVSMYNILLHLFQPTNYLRAASFGHKEKLISFFEPIFELQNDEDYKNSNTDEKIKIIEEKCRHKFSNKFPYVYGDAYKKLEWNGDFDFYNPQFEKIWKNEIDFESKNLILHGAPGTGKTYMTEETIKTRKEVLGQIEYELVQFHPSYGYEDFIEGIKPVGLDSGQMQFELKNGTFKQMCIDAFKNLVESKNDKTKLKTFYFIADEINRAELSRVFGELLLCLEDDKRLRIEGEKVKGTKVKLPNSNLWKKEHVVVSVDSEDKITDSENLKDWYFGVPENIYFIGTMNDIDRSVDSFDMALRRRFVWKHYRCDYDVIEDKFSDDSKIEEYINICKSLNNHITNEKGFNLSDSYELGQSYFMNPKKLIQKELNRVWIEHIAPILKEYLRAEYPENEIKSHLDNAKNIYKLK